MEKLTVLESLYIKDKVEFFDLTMKSIYGQTVKPDRVVLVKDGPVSDEIEACIKKWSDCLPIKVVGYEQNHGLAYALNYGLKYVDTEFVARMDSDDICEPTRFEKQLNFFTENNECQICGTAINEFYICENGEKIEKQRYYPDYVDKKSLYLFKGTPLGHPTVMMKTDLLKKYKYNENTSMNEDIDLWFKLICDDVKIFNLQEPLLNFRITDGTFRRRSIKKALNEFKIYTTNLKKLFGFNKKSIYPFLRLCTRFLPYGINKKLYFSNVRARLFKNKG